jgi:hypothetical protein
MITDSDDDSESDDHDGGHRDRDAGGEEPEAILDPLAT